MADVIVPLAGWGYSTWGTDSWGEGNALPFLTGELGSITVTADAVVSVSGVVGTTALGNATAQVDATVNAIGVTATGELGTLRFDATVLLGGWGRGVWGQGAWGESQVSKLTGP